MVSKKDIFHSKIVDKIEESNFNCKFYLATGSGKTKILIEAINRLKPKSILWTCATEKFRSHGLKEEFDKWGGDFSVVDAICWHSMGNCKKQYDLCVLDEVQMITKRRFSYFTKHSSPHIIACSGTKPRDIYKQNLINSLNLEEIAAVDVDEAVEEELIADYLVEIRYCQLDNVNKIQIKAGFYATEQESYNWYSKKIEYNKAIGDWAAVKKLSLGRARLIYNSISKLNAGLQIVEELKGNRTIIFSKSTKIANTLSSNTFHTVMDKKLAKENYEKFNNLEEEHISVVDAANTSLNFEKIEVVYVHQLDSNPTNYLQRQGRALRIRPGHKAKMIILCIKDTQDEVWVENCIKTLKNVVYGKSY